MTPRVKLRPVAEVDLPKVLAFYTDPDVAGDFQWFGFRPAAAREVEQRWAEDRLIGSKSGRLVVALDDDGYAGEVDWRRSVRPARSRSASACWLSPATIMGPL